mgnify:FL=1
MVEREALEKLCLVFQTGGSNPSLSVSKMKKEIDKTHWTIQTLVFLTIIPMFVFLNQIISFEDIFSSNETTFFFFLPSILSLLLVMISLFCNRKKLFSKEYWYLNDFVYWNIFSCTLSLVAIFHGINSKVFPLIFSQVFAYIALLLGYANELRNEIIEGKFKKGE